MQNKELQAETKDDSEQMPIVISSSPNAAKPNVIRRFIFIILSPLFLVNIFFGTLMLVPYWIFTGNIYYDSKYFQSIINLLFKFLPNGV